MILFQGDRFAYKDDFAHDLASSHSSDYLPEKGERDENFDENQNQTKKTSKKTEKEIY